jgi:NTE family protein
LEELHIPIDVIVGTSAGAIVAASYASGTPLASIELEMSKLHTAMLFRDVDRTETPFRNKANDAINFLGPEVGVNRGTVILPKGVVAGISIEAVLRRLTARQSTQCFDDLPIPFRAVATDLASSEMVVIDHGDLAVALRASMAIPAVLEPVEFEGKLLVDGGLSRNLPIDVARRLGADVVIAVNVGTPLRKRDEITGFLSVSDQISRMLTNTNVNQSLSELRPRDLLITPELGRVESGDFDLLSDASIAGELAARAAAADLRRFSVRDEAYAAWHRTLSQTPQSGPVPVDALRVTGTQRVNPQVISAAITTKVGEPFDPQVADEDVKRIYARGDFEHVSYSLSADPAAGHVLTADVVEKSWGPNYVRFGLGLSSDLHGDSYFSLVAMHRATWLNALGGEWRNDAQIGHADRFASEFYQPLTPAQRVFVALHVETAREPFDVYDDHGNRLASYRRATYGAGFDVGTPLASLGELRLGVSRGRLKFVDDTTAVPGALLVPPTETGGLSARLRIDTLDNLRFPRSGYDADVLVYSSRRQLGASDQYSKFSATVGGAIASDAQSLQLQLRGATSLGSLPLPAYELFSLGGFLALSGYNTDQLVGRALDFGRLVYSYRVSAPGVFDGAYLGASLESGRIGDAVTGNQRSSARYGSAVFFALDSPLGPVYLAYGHGDGRNQAVYFFLGQP